MSAPIVKTLTLTQAEFDALQRAIEFAQDERPSDECSMPLSDVYDRLTAPEPRR